LYSSSKKKRRAIKQRRRCERFRKYGIITNDPRRKVYYRRTFSYPCVSIVERKRMWWSGCSRAIPEPAVPCRLFDSVLTRISTCERSFSAVGQSPERWHVRVLSRRRPAAHLIALAAAADKLTINNKHNDEFFDCIHIIAPDGHFAGLRVVLLLRDMSSHHWEHETVLEFIAIGCRNLWISPAGIAKSEVVGKAWKLWIFGFWIFSQPRSNSGVKSSADRKAVSEFSAFVDSRFFASYIRLDFYRAAWNAVAV